MSTSDKKLEVNQHVEDLPSDADLIHDLHGTAALQVALRLEPVKTRSKRMFQLYGICAIMFLGATMHGYDASLMGNLLQFPYFRSQFGASILGVKAAYISAMYSIGAVSAIPLLGPLSDTWGRRVGIAIGCITILIGTIIQGTSKELPQYLAGRFFIGLGATITGACPLYIVEIAHPAYRGVITGLYNCCYYLGSILSAVILRGCVHYDSNVSWLIPTWFQAVLPGILLLSCMFLPESPRWQYSHGQTSKCLHTLIKYHGDDNPDSLYVRLQMREFKDQLELDGADKRWWDYRCLFDSRASLYRVFLCAVAVSAFAQWSGQGGVSYFLPAMLSTTGITDSDTVLNINLGIALTSGAAACAGASLMDRFGRRNMLITCCATLTLMWVGMVACTGSYYNNGNTSAAKASVAFIFLIGIVFSFAYTPLQQLYPVEVLNYEQRAKGIAFATMGTNAAALVNLFGTPIALQVITWKTYIIYIGTCAGMVVFYYFLMVETKGYTLEELNDIFKQKNPRNASLMKKDVIEDAVVMLNELKQAKEV